MNWPRIQGEHSAANGNRCEYEARIAEQERLPGQAHPENELLKKKNVRCDLKEALGRNARAHEE
ncbi:MAG: hypothetical protein GYA29_00175 [Methanothrix sp.]|jgi:hypothetical protein|nr:hypothetical protein [Methanothrix sp.]